MTTAEYQLGEPDVNGHFPIFLAGKRIGCIRNFGNKLFGSWHAYLVDRDPKSSKDTLIDLGIRTKKRAIRVVVEKYQAHLIQK